jgi:hypothetical protein
MVQNRKKQNELLSILNDRASSNEALSNAVNSPISSYLSERNLEQEKRLLNEQNALLLEAKRLTKSLYRTCLRSVSILAEANTHDEEIFLQRERERLSRKNNYEPPVDRKNELSSRAMYYHSFVQESFQQEMDCLSLISSESSQSRPSFWREEQVTRFVYLMEQGEERRRWILESYKFDDSYREQKNDEDLQESEYRRESSVESRMTQYTVSSALCTYVLSNLLLHHQSFFSSSSLFFKHVYIAYKHFILHTPLRGEFKRFTKH